MKKYLLTGLAILLPFALTIIIAVWFLDILTTPFVGIIEEFLLSYEKSHNLILAHHSKFVLFLSRFCILILLFLITLFLGYLVRRFFLTSALKISNRIFAKIPILSTIYRLCKEITKAFVQEGKTFKQSVLIPFPKENTHALGLVTGDVPSVLKDKIQNIELAVFVPTSPHPISGFILMTPKKQVIPIDVSTEDVFKYLLSCGLTHLEETKENVEKNEL